MDFLRNSPPIELVESHGKHVAFAANLLDKRPRWPEIQNWRTCQWQESCKKTLKNKACPISWFGLFIDAEGLWLLCTAKKLQQMSNMKSALHTLLKPTISEENGFATSEEELQKVVCTLRPLDENDKDRITAWQTPESIREELEEESDDDKVVVKAAARTESKEYSALLNAVLERAKPLLALPPPDIETLCISEFTQSKQGFWHARVQTLATIVFCQTGPIPELKAMRCHREERRVALLLRRSSAKTMAGIVCAAVRLAAEGCFPGPRSKGKSEFIARCAQALKQRVAQAETVLTKLSKEDQAFIRKSLAGQEEKEPYEGCLYEKCLDKEIKWETEENISRCAHCQMPKCYGRTIFGLNDILAPRLKRALGNEAREISGANKRARIYDIDE